MKINPGHNHMPANPTHATITVESQNPETKEKDIKRYKQLLLLYFYCIGVGVGV